MPRAQPSPSRLCPWQGTAIKSKSLSVPRCPPSWQTVDIAAGLRAQRINHMRADYTGGRFHVACSPTAIPCLGQDVHAVPKLNSLRNKARPRQTCSAATCGPTAPQRLPTATAPQPFPQPRSSSGVLVRPISVGSGLQVPAVYPGHPRHHCAEVEDPKHRQISLHACRKLV